MSHRSTDGPGRLPFPASLCHRCAGHRYVATARSTFVMCTLRDDKYPRQPVARCTDFRTPKERASAD